MSWFRLGPSFFFFIFFIVFGVLAVLLSGGIMGVWVGLECGFMGLVCILSGESVQENESCMKYFVYQGLGSSVLFGAFVGLSCSDYLFASWVMFVLGISLKLGVFPFYFWIPSVMSCCSWVGCFMVSVWQKLSPLWFLGSCGFSGHMVVIFKVLSCMTSVVGALGGLGLLHYRSLLGYSSLVHSGWMILVSMLSLSAVMFYLLVYGVISLVLMFRLFSLKIYSFLDFSNVGVGDYNKLVFVFMDFLSLAGIPPLLGAFPKLLSIFLLCSKFPMVLLVLIMCSMVSLFYYLSVIVVAGVGLGMNSVSEQVDVFFKSSFMGWEKVSFIVTSIMGSLMLVFIDFFL